MGDICKRNYGIKHSSIFNYWKDKAITRDGNVIPYTDNREESIEVVYDWGEPCCWACGKSVRGIIEYSSYEEKLKKNVSAIWDYSKVREKLNKCHIKPHSMGGSEDASNYFLLCEECHVESPDTLNPTNFYRWVYKRRKSEGKINGFSLSQLVKDFIEECKMRNKDPYTIDVSKAMFCNHGNKLSHSTIYMGLVDTCKDL